MWRRTGSDPEAAKASRDGLAVGTAGVLCLAFLDLIAGTLDSGGPAGAGLPIQPLAAAALLFACLFCAPWIAGRLLRLNPVPLAASIVLFLAIFSSLDLIHEPNFTSPRLQHRLAAGAVLACSLAGGAALYLLLRGSGTARLSGRAANLAGTAPVVLAATALLVWLLQTRPPGLPAPVIWAGYAVTVATTVVILRRLRPGAGFLAGLLALTLLSPMPGLLFSAGLTTRDAGAGKEHAVSRVILLSVDTLRADVLSAYGGGRIATPHIDRLAGDGVLFRQAVSPAPWTIPAFASIMTGLLPSVHGALAPKSRLPDSLETLAERLRAAGYATAAIGGSDMLAVERNLSQGFDRYDFAPVRKPGISFGERLLHRLDRTQHAWPDWTDRLPDLATGWLKDNRNRPFFLWLHYYDPHLGYAPPPRFLPAGKPPKRIGRRFGKLPSVRNGHLVPTPSERDWIRSLYEAEVRHVDDSIGRLLESLKRLELYDDSLIVFTSDHGEEFWEHGGFEHGHSMHQEVLQVPLLIKLPGARPSEVREVDHPVSTAALLPTVLELCDVDYRPGDLSAASFAPLLEAGGPQPVIAEPIVSTGTLYFEDRVSIVFDRTKYVRWLDSGKEELYDLAADPAETISIADSAPDRLERARQLLAETEAESRALRQVHKVPRDGEETELDAETLRRLRALGYVE